jgi:hypothetical protein
VPNRGLALPMMLLLVLALTPTLLSAQEAPVPGEDGLSVPAPWGVGVTLYNQTQGYHIDTLEVQFEGLDPQTLTGLPVDNETTTYHLKLDYWLFPFLNVYALFGTIDGVTTVQLSQVDVGLPISLNNLVVDYNGLVYGGGLTLAGGFDHYFATLTYDYNQTDLDVSDSSVKASVLTPRFGYHTGPAAIYVGGMYQKAEETHEGVFEMPYLGAIPYRVVLREKEAWNYLIGLNAGLSQHWMVTVEGFFGERDAVLATLDYRWGR